MKIQNYVILSAFLSAGCGHFDYAVEPVKEVKPETPASSGDNANEGNLAAKLHESCKEIELKSGTYLGQKGLLSIEYEVLSNGGRCTLRLLYQHSELYDSNCDNTIEVLSISDVGTFYRETLQKQGYTEKLDGLLKWGQTFACLENEKSNIQLKLRFKEIFGSYEAVNGK